jgi:hypothetical protein
VPLAVVVEFEVLVDVAAVVVVKGAVDLVVELVAVVSLDTTGLRVLALFPF